MPALAEERWRGRKGVKTRAPSLRPSLVDIYDALARSRVGIKLVDRSARDIPELGKIWFGGGRGFLVEALCHYLSASDYGRAACALPFDVEIAARFIVETCAFWAVHRHWDVGRSD